MNMSGVPFGRVLVRTETASLDPVGATLALDGRLASADALEDLPGALRQASREAAAAADATAQQATATQSCTGAAEAAAPGPTCLSAVAHRLPDELLDAFAAAPHCSDGGGAAAAVEQQQQQQQQQLPCSPGGDVMLPRRLSDSLGQQESLVDPPAPLQQRAPARAGSPPTRPPVCAAIERTSTATLDANGGVDHGAGVHDPSCTCPPYAVKSTCGKRPNMEDTYALCPNICELPMSPMALDYADKLPHRIAGQFETHCMYPPPEPSIAVGGAAAAVTAAGAAAGNSGSGVSSSTAEAAAAAAAAAASTTGSRADAPQTAAGAGVQPQDALHQRSLSPQQLQQPHHTEAMMPEALQATAADTAVSFAGSASLMATCEPPAGVREASMSSLSSGDSGSGAVEKLHFFGVYDGHGGIEASQHCAQRLHYHLSRAVAEMAGAGMDSAAAGGWNAESKFVPLDTVRIGESNSSEAAAECALAAAATCSEDPSAAAAAAAAAAASAAASPGAASSLSSELGGRASLESSSGSSGDGEPALLLGRSVSSVSTGASKHATEAGAVPSPGDGDASDSSGDAGGGEAAAITASLSFCELVEGVLRQAFLRTDEEFSNSGLQAGLVGSTAVVALVGTHRVWIANCGDSRAVLSRGGVAVQVTDDHKPEREDEAERVEKAGGQVLYWNGHRVMGVLAMSRAIGDHCLRPYVIPEPEISVFARHACDEILLLASDGLWDVLSNQEAADLALRSMRRAREKGASRKAAARVAATVLTKAAVDRGSRDNITVVIIDLAPPVADGGGRGGAHHGTQQVPNRCSPSPGFGGIDVCMGPCSGAAAEDTASAPGGVGQGADAAAAAALQQGMQQTAPPMPAVVPALPPPSRSNSSAVSGAIAAKPPHRSSGSGTRPSSSGSSGAGRTRGALGGSGSCGGSNPFAAAATSPFSTAATGSSELPVPSNASGSSAADAAAAALAAAAAVAAAAAAAASSATAGAGTGGRTSANHSASTSAASSSGGSSSSAFASARGQEAVLRGSGARGSSGFTASGNLAKQLSNVQLSGGCSTLQLNGEGVRCCCAANGEGMPCCCAAGDGSASSLEEQITLVEPPPGLAPAAGSSPFSSAQNAAPFGDG